WMPVKNARAKMAVSARVGELKTDQQAIIASTFASMFGDQRLAQILDITQGLLAEQKLIRVRAPVRAHRDGLAAPDEFRAARSKMLPSADRQRTRPAVRRSVPAFHRLDRESVADTHAVELHGLRERRCVSFSQNRIARNR